MKKGIALVLLGTMLLSGCGGQTEETTLPPTVPVTTAAPATEPPTAAPTEAPTEALTEPVAFRNPLNGQPMAEESDLRPIAIMLNNHTEALPQSGVGAADIIYETLVEGSITRLCAVFSDAHEAGPIGPVRSLRPYFFDIIRGYDAIASSAGGPPEALNPVYNLGYDYINGIGSQGGSFYRDDWRKANRGYEHSLMVKGEKLYAAAEAGGMRLTAEADRDYGLHFDENALMGGEPVSSATISFQNGGKTTKITYHEDKQGYTAFQQGQEFIDANTKEPVVFRNVLVLRTDIGTASNGVHKTVRTTGEGQGLFFWDGKQMPITWKRDGLTDAFQYLDHSGNPISMGVGKTYIAIISDNAPVEMTE